MKDKSNYDLLKKRYTDIFPYHKLDSYFFKNRQIAKPITDSIGRFFLDNSISKNIDKLKKKQPSLIIGETHCHSTFSDGLHSVENILERASRLGLDYVVITDHILPGKYLTESIINCWEKQTSYLNEWDQANEPVKIYPAFELSTLEGHLILILDPEYFSSEKYSDISLQFSNFNYQFPSMLDAIPLIKPFGGISIVAHPNQNRSYPFGASIKWVKENLIGLIDGIEDISSGHGYQESYSNELGIASTGSSDDHFNLLMGTAITAYNGHNHNNLITAIKSRETKAITVDNSMEILLKLMRQAHDLAMS
jgi:hypothetical protein